MKIICINGFYKFYPENIGDVKRFQIKYGVSLVQCENYFTFETLAKLPNYSFIGHPYSGSIVGLANYAGNRQEVMTANGLSWRLDLKRLILTSSYSGFKKMNYDTGNFIIMTDLPQAYFYDKAGLITGFTAFLDLNFMRYRIEKFYYAEVN